jgi:hypothetical protein
MGFNSAFKGLRHKIDWPDKVYVIFSSHWIILQALIWVIRGKSDLIDSTDYVKFEIGPAAESRDRSENKSKPIWIILSDSGRDWATLLQAAASRSVSLASVTILE